jgi:YYY domain-containing protein
LAAATLAVVAGNLHGFVQIVNWLGSLDRSPILSNVPGLGGALSAIRGTFTWITTLGQGHPPLNFNFWDPTRVITTEPVHPITEFPFFTFLYGDLHAHMISMPFGLLVVALALNLIRQPVWVPTFRERSLRSALLDVLRAALTPGGITLILAALTIGVLRMSNSWDYPTYLGLFVATLVLAEALRRRTSLLQRRHQTVEAWGPAAARVVVLVGITVVAGQVLIGPYLANYELFYGGFERAVGHTSASHYIIIMGSFLGILALYLAFQISALRRTLFQGALSALGGASGVIAARPVAEAGIPSLGIAPAAQRLAAALIGVSGFLAVLLLIAGLPVVGIAGLGIAALALVAFLRRPPPATLFAFLLSATALALTAGVELITLKGGVGRMNTVFKFYLPAWLFLSLSVGMLLALMARRAWGSPWLVSGGRLIAAVAVGLLLAATLIYPWLGTPSKLRHRFDVQLPLTLDGMAFMSQARYEDNMRDLALPHDFAAINWMLDNIQGTPVIVEGLAPLYHWRSRVSIYTGLPAVLGWDWHQKQQRGDFGYMVDDRARDVDTLFNTPDASTAMRLLRKYNVEYIYVGGQERAFYAPQNLAKFDQMAELTRVYQQGAVTIYRVVS